MLWGALLAASLCLAQSRETNPYASKEDIAEGRRLYSLFCVFCHGMDGASGRGARLATTFRRHGTSDQDQYRVIANGVPGTEMAGHWLEEEEIWKILAFVRTLERSAAPRGAACQATPGDPRRGRALFFSKGACLKCHFVTVDGRQYGSGRLGPDLTHLGQARSRAQLREALVEPSKSVAPRYRQVRVITRSRHAHAGLLLNEDEYTLHLIDAGEQTRSFLKADLNKIERPADSFMPSYQTALKAEELDDLLSFLCTLEGGTP